MSSLSDAPDDVVYFMGAQIGVYHNITWTDYMNCRECGEPAWHKYVRVEGFAKEKPQCNVCGHTTGIAVDANGKAIESYNLVTRDVGMGNVEWYRVVYVREREDRSIVVDGARVYDDSPWRFCPDRDMPLTELSPDELVA